MAFIIVSNKGAEVCRQELVGGLTLGRAADCGLSVHDILLSRHHCRIEPSGRGWVILDLRSKNGTWLDGERVGRRSLRHGEVVRAGNTTVRFMIGEMPASEDPPTPRKQRPADPIEALAGTVYDFDARDLDDEPQFQRSRVRAGMPYPRPVPRDPVAYAREGVYGLLEEIASSSWDSIYANVSRPTRPAPAVRGGPLAAGGQPDSTSSTTSRQTVSEQAGLAVDAASKVSSAKRPQVPGRRRSANATAAPDTVPLGARSRLQVDFSLQAPAVRARHGVRVPFASAHNPPVVSLSNASKARSPDLTALPAQRTRRARRGIARALSRIHRYVVAKGAVWLL